MIWILVETLLVVLGIFAFNRFLRKGIENDMAHRDPLDEMYLRAEDENPEEEEKPKSVSEESKKLPKA